MSKRNTRRNRPSRHYRRVHTKKGKKKILINPKIKKPSRKTKVRGTITKSHRKVFNYISDPNKFTYEFGGGIDFDKKGRIENINVAPGSTYEIDLPPDFEVQYHTHPDRKISPPSPEDVMALLDNKDQQAEIIFRDGKSFQIIKTPSSKALSKLPATHLFSMLDKAFYSSIGPNFEENWKKKLEELGFIVYINNNPNQPMNVRIKPVEPKYKKKRKRKWK